MTIEELRKIFSEFSDRYGIEVPLPKTFEVDSETYANVLQFILNKATFEDWAQMTGQENIQWITIAMGPNRGLMYKGVELILKKT